MTGKQVFVRSLLTAGLPVILVYAFVEELCRGLRSALRDARLEVRANIEAYHKAMERKDY